MTGNDTNTEQELQTIDGELKISLQVRMNDKGQIAISCNYNKASSTLLLQSIAYMLDTAYRGEKEIAIEVANQIPDIVTEYFRLAELQNDVSNAEDTLQDTIESINNKTLEAMLKAELDKDPKDRDIDYFMRLSSELMKREVESGQTTQETEEKTTDSK